MLLLTIQSPPSPLVSNPCMWNLGANWRTLKQARTVVYSTFIVCWVPNVQPKIIYLFIFYEFIRCKRCFFPHAWNSHPECFSYTEVSCDFSHKADSQERKIENHFIFNWTPLENNPHKHKRVAVSLYGQRILLT